MLSALRQLHAIDGNGLALMKLEEIHAVPRCCHSHRYISCVLDTTFTLAQQLFPQIAPVLGLTIEITITSITRQVRHAGSSDSLVDARQKPQAPRRQ